MHINVGGEKGGERERERERERGRRREIRSEPNLASYSQIPPLSLVLATKDK